MIIIKIYHSLLIYVYLNMYILSLLKLNNSFYSNNKLTANEMSEIADLFYTSFKFTNVVSLKIDFSNN